MNRYELAALYDSVRARTEALCGPLAVEDMVVQSMPDASPTKWHLAHTTWFFETFVLRASGIDYRSPDERYAVLFNSYYVAAGDRHPRPERGLLSRPTVAEVLAYREQVDAALRDIFAKATPAFFEKYAFVIEVGLNHEEQHQELLVTDIKHVLANNPLYPVYRDTARAPKSAPQIARGWARFAGGLVDIGHAGDGFAYDNEQPRHQVYLQPFEVADRLVTCGEYLAFMHDGGYERSDLWLSDGWEARTVHGWEAPLYWQRDAGEWRVATLAGLQSVQPQAPVDHVSYYEADAYARWAGARLPREEEWEHAAASVEPRGNLLDSELLQPRPLLEPPAPGAVAQLFGDVWEWTASPYVSYPGYTPFPGALAEYNGKFMCNQMVLRGGSCATPARHIRPTYRNFFPPAARWQFSGIRLAR